MNSCNHDIVIPLDSSKIECQKCNEIIDYELSNDAPVGDSE